MAINRGIAAILILALLLVSFLAGDIIIRRGGAAYAGDKICSAANEPVSDGEDNGIERTQLAD
jgi:hypothetical protein